MVDANSTIAVCLNDGSRLFARLSRAYGREAFEQMRIVPLTPENWPGLRSAVRQAGRVLRAAGAYTGAMPLQAVTGRRARAARRPRLCFKRRVSGGHPAPACSPSDARRRLLVGCKSARAPTRRNGTGPAASPPMKAATEDARVWAASVLLREVVGARTGRDGCAVGRRGEVRKEERRARYRSLPDRGPRQRWRRLCGPRHHVRARRLQGKSRAAREPATDAARSGASSPPTACSSRRIGAQPSRNIVSSSAIVVW